MEKLRIVGAVILDEGDRFFSLDQVIAATGFERKEVRRILCRLNKEGLVLNVTKNPSCAKASEGKPGRPQLRFIYRVKNKGKFTERVSPRQRENTAQDKMWSVIRNKSKFDGKFTVRDIIVLAEVKKENARWYLKQLRRAGYASCNGKGGPGVSWKLIKDVGPRRPNIGGGKL